MFIDEATQEAVSRVADLAKNKAEVWANRNILSTARKTVENTKLGSSYAKSAALAEDVVKTGRMARAWRWLGRGASAGLKLLEVKDYAVATYDIATALKQDKVDKLELAQGVGDLAGATGTSIVGLGATLSWGGPAGTFMGAGAGALYGGGKWAADKAVEQRLYDIEFESVLENYPNSARNDPRWKGYLEVRQGLRDQEKRQKQNEQLRSITRAFAITGGLGM
jgi:hypothetical protein